MTSNHRFNFQAKNLIFFNYLDELAGCKHHNALIYETTTTTTTTNEPLVCQLLCLANSLACLMIFLDPSKLSHTDTTSSLHVVFHMASYKARTHPRY